MVGDDEGFFAAPATIDRSRPSISRHPDAMLVGGATDVGLWITKQLRDLPKIIWLGRVRGLDRIDDMQATPITLGAMVTHADSAAASRRHRSRPRRADAALRRRAGAQRRHGRRQYRQRLADRRHAAGADRARRDADAAAGRADAHPAAGRFLPRLRQAGPRAGRIRAQRTRAKAAAATSASAATRCPSASTRTFRPSWAPSSSLSTAAASPRRASPMAAWRQRRSARAGAEAALARRGPRRCREPGDAALDALAQDFSPLTDQRASARYRSEVAAALLAQGADRRSPDADRATPGSSACGRCVDAARA